MPGEPGGDLASRLERLLGGPVTGVRRRGGDHGVEHVQAERGNAPAVFAKLAVTGAGQGFAAEAAGLRWLAEAGAAPVPEVLGVSDDGLAIAWLPPGQPDRQSAARFGQELAALHWAGAARFGAPWPGVIAGLPLDNDAPGDGQDWADEGWADWYARARVLPFLRRARDAGALTSADATLVERAAGHAATVAGPAEPPARIHGDCWSGNVLWSGGRGWLIDPAAHGGHRETDLAMLALFGVPYLDDILGGYLEAAPLADGWRDRVPLHQLHPLLVHGCLFGSGYAEPARAAARAVLAL